MSDAPDIDTGAMLDKIVGALFREPDCPLTPPPVPRPGRTRDTRDPDYAYATRFCKPGQMVPVYHVATNRPVFDLPVYVFADFRYLRARRPDLSETECVRRVAVRYRISHAAVRAFVHELNCD